MFKWQELARWIDNLTDEEKQLPAAFRELDAEVYYPVVEMPEVTVAPFCVLGKSE